MSNELLVYAQTIREAAKKLAEEPEDSILIDDDTKKKVNKELQQYATFLRKFLSVKNNEELFAKLSPLFDNPKVRKPRNTILLMLEKGEQVGKPKAANELIPDLRKILLRYGGMVDRYPAIKLIKEILNYGVVNGVPAFKRLLSIERRLYNTFGAQGTLEKEKKQKEKTK